jgi:hypothetical protein
MPVQQTEAFAESLQAHGVAVTLKIFPHARHGIPIDDQSALPCDGTVMTHEPRGASWRGGCLGRRLRHAVTRRLRGMAGISGMTRDAGAEAIGLRYTE